MQSFAGERVEKAGRVADEGTSRARPTRDAATERPAPLIGSPTAPPPTTGVAGEPGIAAMTTRAPRPRRRRPAARSASERPARTTPMLTRPPGTGQTAYRRGATTSRASTGTAGAARRRRATSARPARRARGRRTTPAARATAECDRRPPTTRHRSLAAVSRPAVPSPAATAERHPDRPPPDHHPGRRGDPRAGGDRARTGRSRPRRGRASVGAVGQPERCPAGVSTRIAGSAARAADQVHEDDDRARRKRSDRRR